MPLGTSVGCRAWGGVNVLRAWSQSAQLNQTLLEPQGSLLVQRQREGLGAGRDTVAPQHTVGWAPRGGKRGGPARVEGNLLKCRRRDQEWSPGQALWTALARWVWPGDEAPGSGP